MTVAATETIMAAIATKLGAITGISGLTVTREPDAALTALPALALFEGDCTPQQDFTGQRDWTLGVDIEAFAGGTDARAAAATLSLLVAKVTTALVADVTLGIGCRDLRPASGAAPVRGDVQGQITFRAISLRFEVDYATPETDFTTILGSS